MCLLNKFVILENFDSKYALIQTSGLRFFFFFFFPGSVRRLFQNDPNVPYLDLGLDFGHSLKCTKCVWLVFTPQIVLIYWEICLVLSWIDKLSWLFKREGSVIVKGQRNRFQGSKNRTEQVMCWSGDLRWERNGFGFNG